MENVSKIGEIVFAEAGLAVMQVGQDLYLVGEKVLRMNEENFKGFVIAQDLVCRKAISGLPWSDETAKGFALFIHLTSTTNQFYLWGRIQAATQESNSFDPLLPLHPYIEKLMVAIFCGLPIPPMSDAIKEMILDNK